MSSSSRVRTRLDRRPNTLGAGLPHTWRTRSGRARALSSRLALASSRTAFSVPVDSSERVVETSTSAGPIVGAGTSTTRSCAVTDGLDNLLHERAFRWRGRRASDGACAPDAAGVDELLAARGRQADALEDAVVDQQHHGLGLAQGRGRARRAARWRPLQRRWQEARRLRLDGEDLAVGQRLGQPAVTTSTPGSHAGRRCRP